MAVVVVDEGEGVVVEFGGEAEGVCKGAGACGGDGAEGGVVVVGDGLIEGADGDDVGHILVAVVQEEGRALAVLSEAEGARGEGLRGIPNELLVDVPRAVGKELLDAEVAIVEEDGVGDLAVAFHLLVEGAPPHAVEGHRDHGVAGLPADGAVLSIVDDRPNARLGLDEGLIAIVVVLWREVIDLGVLVEIVGGVGLAFGGRAVSDVVVGVGKVVGGNEFVADVVAVLLVIDKNTATTKEGSSPL